MSDSNTSSEINVNLYDNNGKIENKTDMKKSSDTDYYFNLIANQNKTVAEKVESSSSSSNYETDSDVSKKTSSIKKESKKTETSTDSDSSSKKSSTSSRGSRNRYETINFGNSKAPEKSTVKENFNQVKENTFVPTTTTQQLSPQEIRMKKIELLRKLSEIKSKGFSLTKEYDFNSSLEEMEYEFELLKSFVDKRNGIKIYKNILLNGVSIMEFLNEKYDPFDFHLEGWGEHMSVEIDSYDDVLEELYEKYKGTGKKMAPEIKLVLLMVASGSAFHFSKSQSSIPGLESVLTKNPELISKLLNPQKPKSQFMTEQEIHIDKQRALIQQKEKEQKQKQMNRQPAQNNSPFSGMPNFASLFGGKPSPPQQPVAPPPPPQQSYMNPPVINSPNMRVQTDVSNRLQPETPKMNVPEIRAPHNVHEILNRIRSQNLNSNTDSIDSTGSNNDRLVSDVNLSESKKGKKGKKQNISIPSISINTN